MPMRILAWLLLGVALPAAGQPLDPGRYIVVPSQSQVRFSVKKWSVLDVDGFFRRFRGEIRYDPHTPSKSSVIVDVETASVTTGDEKRDESLAEPQFFDSQRVPIMRFASGGVTTAAGGMAVTGNLTIKDTTRPVTVRVRLLGVQDIPGEGKFATFATEFIVDRRDYQVLGGSLSRTMIGNEVSIRLTLGGKFIGK